MEKLQRNYRIEFEIGTRTLNAEYTPQEYLEISYPVTLKFDVTKNCYSSANTGTFQLYNLSPQTQKQLHKDLYNYDKYILMKVYAGYQNTMPLIFWGNIMQCYSVRQSGSVDFITSIQANNIINLYDYGFINNTYSEGTAPEFLLQSLLNDAIPDVQIGYISEELKPLQSDQTYLGNMYDLIRDEYPDKQIFLDNNQFNILDDNEVLPGDIQIITASTGLLGTPERAETHWVLNTIFEPGLKIGQAVTVISTTAAYMNQAYKVVALRHSGIISPVESGKLTTQITLYMGDSIFKELKKALPAKTYGGEQTPGTWQKPLDSARVSSPFGYRKAPTQGASTYHKGIDLAAPKDTPVKAAANGIVATTGWNGGYGNTVKINHGKINNVELMSQYSHLNKWAVSPNQQVAAGQVIGYVGTTGTSTGYHLHFEIKENGKAVNPTKYIGKYA